MKKRLQRVFGYWSRGDSIAELASALRRNRSTGSQGPFRIAIFAETNEELTQRKDIAASQMARGFRPEGEGIFYGDRPMEGKVATVFSGVATAYPGLGYEFFSLVPEIGQAQLHEFPVLKDLYFDILDPNLSKFRHDSIKPLAGVMTSTNYYSIVRDVLKLQVNAVMGVSLGESSMLFGIGAYTDSNMHYTRFVESGLFDKLGLYSDSPYVLPKSGETEITFENWNFMGTTEQISEVADRASDADDIEVTVFASPNNCLVGGSAEGCRRFADMFPGLNPKSIDFNCAIHTRHARMAENELQYVLDIPCRNSGDVDVYSLIAEGRVDPVADRVEKDILQQMIQPIDARSHIERVWNDGVRTFVEVGYHGWLTRCVKDTLAGKSHLAVTTNIRGVKPVYQLALAMGKLYAHGIDSRLDVLAIHCSPDHCIAGTV